MQLSLRASPANIYALAHFLIERGSPGAVPTKPSLAASFAATRDCSPLRGDINRFVGAIARLSPRASRPRLSWKIIGQGNWQHSWKRFIKPRRVGKSFWVTPPWLEPPKFRRRRVITI